MRGCDVGGVELGAQGGGRKCPNPPFPELQGWEGQVEGLEQSLLHHHHPPLRVPRQEDDCSVYAVAVEVCSDHPPTPPSALRVKTSPMPLSCSPTRSLGASSLGGRSSSLRWSILSASCSGR